MIHNVQANLVLADVSDAFIQKEYVPRLQDLVAKAPGALAINNREKPLFVFFGLLASWCCEMMENPQCSRRSIPSLHSPQQ